MRSSRLSFLDGALIALGLGLAFGLAQDVQQRAMADAEIDAVRVTDCVARAEAASGSIAAKRESPVECRAELERTAARQTLDDRI